MSSSLNICDKSGCNRLALATCSYNDTVIWICSIHYPKVRNLAVEDINIFMNEYDKDTQRELLDMEKRLKEQEKALVSAILDKYAPVFKKLAKT